MLTVDDLFTIRLRGQRMIAEGADPTDLIKTITREQIYYKEQNEKRKRDKKTK